MDFTNEIFKSGVQNFLSNEEIARDAAQDALGFVTQDGRQRLCGGRLLLGVEGTAGALRGLWLAYDIHGNQLFYRKTETTLDYWTGTVWQNVLTGLTTGTEASFANYSSLAGTFMFFVTTDGYWKINTANPTVAIQMYDSAVNFHGRILIDKGRTLLYRRDDTKTGGNKDMTGEYGSHIDPQGSNYTTVTAESLGAFSVNPFSASLAFHAADAHRFGFGVKLVPAKTITMTIASPAVVSLTAHGLQAGDTIIFYTTGALPTGVTAGTTYYVIAAGLTADQFQFSATAGGAAINSSVGQSGAHTMTSSRFEILVDNYDGTLSSSLGGTGTVVYATGAVTANFFTTFAGDVRASYQWENSNSGGLTDFTHTATRVAAEGFAIPQDQGGDSTQIIVIGQDGAYYSVKEHSTYRFAMDDTDLKPDNNIWNIQLGCPSPNGAVSTQRGIVTINTANPEKPELTVIEKNQLGNIVPRVLCPAFKFANYDYSDCYFDTYERYITITCKKSGSAVNDTLLLVNAGAETVDILPYGGRMTMHDNSGNLYIGSAIAQTVYQILNGFDDLGDAINAYWLSKAERYTIPGVRQIKWRFISENLKKFRKLKVRGYIGISQVVPVYLVLDDANPIQIGTIRGDGPYVSVSEPQMIGSNFIGNSQIGGDNLTPVYPYMLEFKLSKIPKFRKRAIKFAPTGIGYFDFAFLSDWDLMIFESRLPSQYRLKQGVSLDGTKTDQ